MAPIFDYVCQTCKTEFEVLVHLGETAKSCPSCGSEDLFKKVSLTSFVLVGDGWAKDGYATKKM